METILLSGHPKGLRLAHLVDGHLKKLAFEPTFAKGHAQLDDVFSVRVTAVRRDFIWLDLGLSQPAVLKTSHFLGKPPLEGSYIWVQINRMPWPEFGALGHHEKGYRATSHITMAGRFWLYSPLARANAKWVRRTAFSADDKNPAIQVEQEWLTKIALRLQAPPDRVGIFHKALTQWQRWMRDADEGVSVICETPAIMEAVRTWCSSQSYLKCPMLTLATQDQLPLFNTFGVEDHWAEALSPTIHMKGGGSLDIRELPAASLIDVNGGAERHDALYLNTKALPIIAQQIIWRNISGNILIDFVRLPENAQKAFAQNVTEAFKGTDVRVIGYCSLGLFQLQRTRLRPSLSMELLTLCTACHGDGLL